MTDDEPVTDNDDGGDGRAFLGVRTVLRRGITEALNALGAEHGCPPLAWSLRPDGTLRRHPESARRPGDGPPPLLDEWALTGWIELQRWGGPIEEGYRVQVSMIVDRELFRRFSGGL
ncbi:MAG TPA: hypothetical protein VIC62_14820 [Nakamurella sp.]|jgi:hypothetical protein